MDETEQPRERNATFGKTMKAVFWSFFGVRKRRDYDYDAAHLNPFHLLLAALIGLVLFIGGLIAVVKFAVSK